MNGESILLSFVGNRDPYTAPEGEAAGPLLSLLRARPFGRVVLFCTGGEYIERARMVEEALREEGSAPRFNFVSVALDSPVDYEQIFRELSSGLEQFLSTIAHHNPRFSVLLDPGTPQMQTAWFLLVASGRIEAELLQGVPPRFADGAYKVRRVELERNLFPGIRISSGEVGEADKADEPGPSTEPARTRESAEGPARAPSDQVSQTERLWVRSSDTPVIGESERFREVMETTRRVAPYDVSVLIHGETGTGKEVVARLLHELGTRSDGPFIAINCAAITTSLAESEFFGHEKGAFTGAERKRLGQFRAASGGTVFLDEIGDLPLEVQAKLLRVLETRSVVPVGSDSSTPVDIRVLAATNRDLAEQIREGEFRRDLYERLAQVVIRVPPLRERSSDIPLLLGHFTDAWNRRYKERKGFTPEARRYLSSYPWPGNVRELQNAVSTACALAVSPAIGHELLPRPILEYFHGDRVSTEVPAHLPEEGLDLDALLFQIERGFYVEALERTGGNAEKAAALLGLNGPAFRKAARSRLGILS